MSRIFILPIGSIDPAILRIVSQEVAARLNYNCKVLQNMEEPSYAFEPQRKQYSSSRILKEILNAERSHPVADGAAKLLGIVDVDLCTPILTFIFGEAQLGGRAAIVSLSRLRQEYYGLSPNPGLLMERAIKEAVHELGHTFGLTHCQNPKCVMYFSNSIRNVDVKTDHFCNGCSMLLSEKKRSELE